MPTVHIIQRILPHYRVPLFDLLFTRLASSHISLAVYYGQERPGSVPKSVECDAPWARRISNRYIEFRSQELVWQRYPFIKEPADLTIVEQANRLLLNYILLLRRSTRGNQLAYWGHGLNMQNRNPRTASARIKRRLLNNVDWWFAYTSLTEAVLLDARFPKQSITVLQNSVDTSVLQESLANCDEKCVADARAKSGIAPGPTGIYCGGIYPDKRIPFLLAAVELVQRRIPDFQLIVIGSGPDEHLVRKFAEHRVGVTFLGPLFGSERAPYFKMADVMLIPGLVGLAIVDSFAAQTPLITTDVPIHSPEIAYLETGKNGVMSANDVTAYAQAVVDALQADKLAAMKKSCADSARRYTLEHMAENFSVGIRRALGQ